jgi:hypothetical protein
MPRPATADTSCATARYTTINGAIHAVVAGGTVVVCPGTYGTQAVVLKPVHLEGRDALITAAGQRPVIPGLPGGGGIVSCTPARSSSPVSWWRTQVKFT